MGVCCCSLAVCVQVRTGRRVSIIGSGPAGLAAADQLNKMGHEVRGQLGRMGIGFCLNRTAVLLRLGPTPFQAREAGFSPCEPP